MKKYLILIMFVMIFSGCENGYKEVNFPVLPPELKDCKIYQISNENGTNIYITRCPNSNTSTNYNYGKTNINSSVIEYDNDI